MKKLYLLTAAFCLMATAGYSAGIDNCDSATNWEITLPFSGSGESVSIDTDTTVKTEGDASLKINYVYAAHQWHEARAIVTFPAPIDLSSALKFSFDLYGDTGASSDLIWYIMLESTNGRSLRYLGSLHGSSWKNVEVSLYDMESNPWAGSGDNYISTKVEKMWFVLHQPDGVNSGSATVYIDNIQAIDTDSNTELVVLENFEYASDAELQAAWPTTAGGAGNSVIASVTTEAIEGNALQLDYTLALRWYSIFASYELPSPMDFGEYDFLRFWVKGQPEANYPAGTGPLMMVYLEDETVNRMRAFCAQGPKMDDWNSYVLFLDKVDNTDPGSTPTAPFLQDPWDATPSTYIDFSNIAKIHMVYIENGTDANYTTTLLIDKIELGRMDPNAVFPSVMNYNVNVIGSENTAPTIDGVASAGEWDLAASPGCTDFVHHDNNALAASEDPEVKALFNANALYVLYQVPNANFSLDFAPTGQVRDPSGTAFTGDDFEFFIAPGGNMSDYYYHLVFFPYPVDNHCYLWDEYSGAGAASWNASYDQAAFNYTGGVLTIEYMIRWTSFDQSTARVVRAPSDGDEWGIQIGQINNNPYEAVNWEPDATGGFAAGRPFGTWVFVGEATPLTGVETWGNYR